MTGLFKNNRWSTWMLLRPMWKKGLIKIERCNENFLPYHFISNHSRMVSYGLHQSPKSQRYKEANKSDSAAYHWTNSWTVPNGRRPITISWWPWAIHCGYCTRMALVFDGWESVAALGHGRYSGQPGIFGLCGFKGAVYGLGTFEGNIEKTPLPQLYTGLQISKKWERVAR